MTNSDDATERLKAADEELGAPALQIAEQAKHHREAAEEDE